MRILPALTLIIAALIAVLPFGADAGMRQAMGFLPVMVAHYWSARRPALVPVPLIFAVGVGIDILTQKALGFTAVLLLVVAALAPVEIWLTGRSTAVGRSLVYAAAMLTAAGCAWAIAGAYMGMMLPGASYLQTALTAMALYPFMALALIGIDRLWETPRAQIFVRGG